jgi:hypothetical protein
VPLQLQQQNIAKEKINKYPSRRLYRTAVQKRGGMVLCDPVPKLIDCALTRMVLGQALAVFQAFSLAKPRIS